jgi:hypothetical protein
MHFVNFAQIYVILSIIENSHTLYNIPMTRIADSELFDIEFLILEENIIVISYEATQAISYDCKIAIGNIILREYQVSLQMHLNIIIIVMGQIIWEMRRKIHIQPLEKSPSSVLSTTVAVVFIRYHLFHFIIRKICFTLLPFISASLICYCSPPDSPNYRNYAHFPIIMTSFPSFQPNSRRGYEIKLLDIRVHVTEVLWAGQPFMFHRSQ